MKHADKPQFTMAMDSMRGVFQGADRRLETAIDAYFEHLMDCDLSRVLRAIDLAIRTLDTFPSINKLRTLAGAHDDAQICEQCRVPTQAHIQEITTKLYEELNHDIPLTLERVYVHAQLSYQDHPKLRLWAKQAIAKIEGWSTLPKRLHTPEQQAERIENLLERRYSLYEIDIYGLLSFDK